MKVYILGSTALMLAVGIAQSTTAHAQQVGTVTVCYYSQECGFAQTPNGVQGVRGVPRIRSRHDIGEHRAARVKAATDVSPVDAPAFEFTNSGSAIITDAKFLIEASPADGVAKDTFRIGSIAPGASFVIVPGASDDGKMHASGAFFTHSASNTALDTSDQGPDANDLVFLFVGRVAGAKVSSGRIAVAKSIAPSADGTVAAINFLGGPGNADGPCSDCVAPKAVAIITTSQHP